MEAYIIVIDGGGTKTKGRAYDLSGNLLREHVDGFANPMVDIDLSADHLSDTVEALAVEELPKAIVMGVAGSLQKRTGDLLLDSVKLRLKSDLKKVEIILVDDLTLSYYAVFKRGSGILGLVGTGSALLAESDSKWVRMGGFGHILGDEGSGYVLAVETVKEAIWRNDRGDEQLANRVADYFGIDDIEAIKDVVYRAPKSELAALSKKVFEWEREAGLTHIIEGQIKAFSELVLALVKRTSKEKPEIKLIGGMVQNNPGYFNRIREAVVSLLASSGYICTVTCAEADACEGGLYLYEKYVK